MSLEKSEKRRAERTSGSTPGNRTDVRPEVRAERPLDNHTKSASAQPLKADLETGEVLQEYDPTLKWQLQAVARVALGVFDPNIDYDKQAHRIKICMRHPRKINREDEPRIQIRQSEQSLKTYYSGLMACGSVWNCPVCAPKIQHIRAVEVRMAIDNWLNQGGAVVMATHTTQHEKNDLLSDLLPMFNRALQASKSGRAYKGLQADYSIAHSVKALEITHGSNGWHPHAHTVLFLEEKTDLQELASEMFSLWRNSALRVGLREPSRKAFEIVDASKVRSYVTKMGQEYQWNAEHELVKAHSKVGKGQSFTPFDFLRANLDESRPKLMALYAEFAYNFKGRRQLVWSKGSKRELLGEEGLSDQEIADSIGELDPVLADIDLSDWQKIRRRNLQGDLLQIAKEFGGVGVMNFLKVL